jgi:hypothetical protein
VFHQPLGPAPEIETAEAPESEIIEAPEAPELPNTAMETP